MKVLLICFALAAGFILLDYTLAIKCFVCNSYHQHDCADWFDNITQHLTQCSSEHTMCRKVIQEAYYDGKWETRYIRQCAVGGVIGPREGRVCTDRFGTYQVLMRYCHCDNQDGCNGGGSMSAILPLTLTSGVTLYMFPWHMWRS
ncbi:uncharacterized protein LOC121378441 [Gigantopelta aegis]|uniref:uncharacterized protein LOC121378441 n=1 Tax=Gigantopelta aegis TaxID=1735272 RepID=UPI001B88C335|nr:uncharacterized protein LOC121378441 [Gigantopelta aegis]